MEAIMKENSKMEKLKVMAFVSGNLLETLTLESFQSNFFVFHCCRLQ